MNDLTMSEQRALRIYLRDKYRSDLEDWIIIHASKDRVYLRGLSRGEIVSTFIERERLARVRDKLRFVA